MRPQDYVRRYTDAEYLSKKQISEIVGVSMAETVWRLTTDYREKYRFALDIKRFNKLPFSIVIPPSVMALANTAERVMLKYSMLFETYKMRESFSRGIQQLFCVVQRAVGDLFTADDPREFSDSALFI